MEQSKRVNLDESRYDQSTFTGRLKHFSEITDFRLCVKSDKDLDEAKDLLNKYRLGQEPPGTTEEKVWFSKCLYESAFHPDTGEKQNVIGRMSFQVPGGMIITGAMLTFYKSTPAVIFWQWANQSFNALVNYTNRNANSPLSVNQMGVAYVSATFGALITALGLKAGLAGRASPLIQRFVPFAAVASANCINIPLMRQNELQFGIPLVDENGNTASSSKVAAIKGIGQVTLSRIIMAMPGMTILPIIFDKLEKQKWLKNNPRLNAPLQTLGCGVFLTMMTPFACSIFNQTCSISTATLAKLEPQVYHEIKDKYTDGNLPGVLYFNKGL